MTISQINLGVHKLLNWTYLDPRYLHTSLGFPIHMAPPQVHPTSDTSTSNDAIELKKQHEWLIGPDIQLKLPLWS